MAYLVRLLPVPPYLLHVAGKANGGQGGIRTHGELPPTTVFKTVALNHSATCPHTKRPLASALWDGKRR